MAIGALRVEQVDTRDDAAMHAAYVIHRAAYTAEHPDDPLPTEPEVLARAAAREESHRLEFWLVREEGRPVATFQLDLPMADNQDLAELDLAVDPPEQGRGLGRAVLAAALDRVSALGRHQVIAQVNEPADGSTNRAMRFAAAAGATRSLGEMRRVLDLTALDLPRLAELRREAEGVSSAYDLVGWTGPCPDDLVDGYAALLGRMSTDAPMGGLDIEAEHWDVARVRERDAIMTAQGRTAVATSARHLDSGALVAYTDVVVTRHDPPNAFQWDTLVHRDHRGHRLGLLVKLANLDRLRATAPQAVRVHTWNADENSHMLAINVAMGFQPAQRESAWRLDLPRSKDSES